VKIYQRYTLSLFKFPTNLNALIMSCVTSSSILDIYNGGALDPFHPSRGIRQGDPLSPYLFILCMEILGAFISEKCDAKLWDVVKASQGGIAFSHLFFAYDLVLFAKANQKNCLVVQDALESFCNFFGQKISNENSRVFFSPNVSLLERERFCDFLGFRSTPYLGKYLGFPIKHTSIPHDFSFVLERVQNSWLEGSPTFFCWEISAHTTYDINNTELCDAMFSFTSQNLEQH